MAAAGMQLVELGSVPAAQLADAVISGSWDFAASRNRAEAQRMREVVEGASLLRE